MEVILIISASLIVIGSILYLHHRITGRIDSTFSQTSAKENVNDFAPKQEDRCCGMHLTCQKDSLSPVFNEEILYFDDEELDEYATYAQTDYKSKDVEIFREILLTLRPDEIEAWTRSVQQRGIELPIEIRDEIFLLIDEKRETLLA